MEFSQLLVRFHVGSDVGKSLGPNAKSKSLVSSPESELLVPSLKSQVTVETRKKGKRMGFRSWVKFESLKNKHLSRIAGAT